MRDHVLFWSRVSSSEAAGVTRLVSLVSQRRERGRNGCRGATAVSTRQQHQQHSLVIRGWDWAWEDRVGKLSNWSELELLLMVIKQLGSLFLMCLNPVNMLQIMATPFVWPTRSAEQWETPCSSVVTHRDNVSVLLVMIMTTVMTWGHGNAY